MLYLWTIRYKSKNDQEGPTVNVVSDSIINAIQKSHEWMAAHYYPEEARFDAYDVRRLIEVHR